MQAWTNLGAQAGQGPPVGPCTQVGAGDQTREEKPGLGRGEPGVLWGALGRAGRPGEGGAFGARGEDSGARHGLRIQC